MILTAQGESAERNSACTNNAAVSLSPSPVSFQALRERVQACMLRDRPLLRQRLQRAERLIQRGQPVREYPSTALRAGSSEPGVPVS
jgi:hypothetical protein